MQSLATELRQQRAAVGRRGCCSLGARARAVLKWSKASVKPHCFIVSLDPKWVLERGSSIAQERAPPSRYAEALVDQKPDSEHLSPSFAVEVVAGSHRPLRGWGHDLPALRPRRSGASGLRKPLRGPGSLSPISRVWNPTYYVF